MRYIPSFCLRAGMIVGKDIMGSCEEAFLKKGIILDNSYINTIINMGFAGIYIKDNLSDDIEIISVVSDNLRQKTLIGTKNLFLGIDSESDSQERELEELKKQVNEILEKVINNKSLIINMMDLKSFDNYTYQHSVNVAIISMIFGASIGLNREKLYNLGLGALLHDIGKVFINKDILNKKGKLTKIEFDKIKEHSKLGYEYLKEKFDFPEEVYTATLDHHERIDGNGYPNSKVYKNISLFGRIISIADVFDALTSKRPYREGLQPNEAIEYLMAGAGTAFDYKLVIKFIRNVAAYPVGNYVTLSNGYKAIVIKNFADTNLRPIVRVFEKNGLEVKPFEINLRDDRRYLNTVIESSENTLENSKNA